MPEEKYFHRFGRFLFGRNPPRIFSKIRVALNLGSETVCRLDKPLSNCGNATENIVMMHASAKCHG